MKCIKCGQKATLNLPHHKMALCKEHFLEWVPEQVERWIGKYLMFSPQELILAAVSGGKDSLSLWEILTRLGYPVDGLYIGLGIDGGIGYSSESRRLCEQFALERGLKLHVVDIQETYGTTIPELAQRSRRGIERPCSVCGLVKRHVMNQVAREGGYAVLVTGHNLDDETATLLGNTLDWHTAYLVRQWPVLEADRPGLVRKAKPLCRMYERDMAAYALLRGIDYIYDECPHAVGSNSIYYKEMLNELESRRPGAKINFYVAFLQARENGLFSPQADTGIPNLHPCPTCGQLTAAIGDCAFCQMIDKAAAQASSR